MEELRRIREEAGLSQAQLARESGVDRATINKIEQGKRSPSIATLESLSRALAVEIADFFPKDQAPLPNFEQGHETAARGAALERYKSLRPRLSDIEELGRREQRAVFDECLQLFKDLLLSDLDDVLTDSERREQNLMLDVLQQATWHILALWELGQERGDPDANVINLEEARAAKARLKAAG